MQVAILAGGKGTRLGSLTREIPKPLIKIHGRPVLEHQIRLLASQGFKDIWILVGYLKEPIQKYFGNGSRWGVNIRYMEGAVELNTADRVYQLKNKIKEDFLVIYGDVMMNFYVKKFVEYHKKFKGQLATLVLHPNNHPQDSDIVEVGKSGFVSAMHSKPHPENFTYHNLVNAGVYIFSPQIFSFIRKYPGSDFGKIIFPQMIKKGKKILAYKTPEYFKDMGTVERLKQVNIDLKTGTVRSSSLNIPRSAVFLDRDGVINEEVDQLRRIEDLRVYDFAAKAIRRLNEAGYMVVVATNQPQIARGYITEDYLSVIHKKMETELGKQGAFVDAIYYCPHHKIDDTVTHPVKKYAIDCDCRKPKIGMIKKAAKDLNINLNRSWFIGDTTSEAKTAENAGIKFVGVKTGYAMKDGKYQIPNNLKVLRDLDKAVSYILKHS